MRKLRLAELIGSLFPAIAGGTPSILDLGAMPDQVSLINAFLATNPWPATSFNTYAGTGSVNLSQQQIMSAQDTVLAVTGLTGAAALTLPTVATMLASMTPQQAVVGSSTVLRVYNSTASIGTMTTNTGWTITGTATVGASVWRDYIVTITAIGATPTATMQNIGAGDAT